MSQFLFYAYTSTTQGSQSTLIPGRIIEIASGRRSTIAPPCIRFGHFLALGIKSAKATSILHRVTPRRRDEEKQNDRWVNDPRDDASRCIIRRRKFGLRPRRDQKRQPRGSSVQRTIETRLHVARNVQRNLSSEFYLLITGKQKEIKIETDWYYSTTGSVTLVKRKFRRENQMAAYSEFALSSWVLEIVSSSFRKFSYWNDMKHGTYDERCSLGVGATIESP